MKKLQQEAAKQAQEAQEKAAAEESDISEELVDTVEERAVSEELIEVVEESSVSEELAEAEEESAVSEELEEAAGESAIPEDVAEILSEIDAAASIEQNAVEQEPALKKDKKAKKLKLPNLGKVNLLSKIRINISQKLLAMCLVPMIVICIGMTIFSSQALRTGMEQEIEKSLQIVATSVNETYTNLYEGDYVKSQSGKITKGDTTISGDTQLIDGLKEKTGFEVSFLFGNMRLITTVRNVNGSK